MAKKADTSKSSSDKKAAADAAAADDALAQTGPITISKTSTPAPIVATIDKPDTVEMPSKGFFPGDYVFIAISHPPFQAGSTVRVPDTGDTPNPALSVKVDPDRHKNPAVTGGFDELANG